MPPSLLPLLEKIPGHNILCVGDIMLDRFVYGSVERVSPEAPIPVLRILRESVMLGGAGNVVRNIVSLGGHVDIVGVVGQDPASYELGEQISSLGSVVSYLLNDPQRPTIVKTRYIADGQQLLRTDSEDCRPLSTDMEDQILLRVRGAMASASVVVLSDYAKGVLTDRVVREIIDIASAKGKRVLIDPKGHDYSRYRGATILTPNRKELADTTHMSILTVADAEKAARQLIDAHDLSGVLAKLGGDGVCLVLKNQPIWHFRASAQEVYDVSGAGDTVIATMALALAGGLTAEDSAAMANLAGSVVVGKIGTATISRQELAHALVRNQAQASQDKIMPLFEAADLAEHWRKQGLKVGFTNGVFDLLHPGHLSLISQARAACDKLIIGVNSDASVKRLKGETRPVQNEQARQAVLASLADIDAVVVFEEDTPVELIKAIRPDVLVKGADYTIATVVGADLVQSWGGAIVLANLVEGQSTTATIARLQATEAQKTGTQ